MQVGKPSHSQITINNISWVQEGDLMKILGIYFNDKGCSNIQQNWDERIETIIRYIKMWEKRNLSIIGKIQVIKTFLMSQMVYLMQAIILPEDILKKINSIYSLQIFVEKEIFKQKGIWKSKMGCCLWRFCQWWCEDDKYYRYAEFFCCTVVRTVVYE